MEKDKEKEKKNSILEAQEKAILLQRQIMDNSRNINEYYKDFESWVDEMNKKDDKILNIKSKEPQKEIIINEDAEIEYKKEKIKKAKELAKQNKLKRDGNSIKDYYDNWDRVNEDDELIDIESKISMNSNSNEEIIKNLYNENQNQKSRIISEEEEKKNDGEIIDINKKSVFNGFNKFFKYFGAEYSFTKFKINCNKCICSFGTDNIINIASYDGKFYQVGFEPVNNSESFKIQEEKF